VEIAMNVFANSVAVVVLLSLCVVAYADVPLKPSLSLDGARRVAGAAEAYAREHKAPGAAIAVVDDGGQLVYLARLDGTFPAGSRISTGKARTAALFRKPTKVFEEIVNKGRTAMVALEDFTPLQGGVPLVVKGQVIGAIGVSGAASADQDTAIAEAGAKAAEALAE
jgi:uncharacterized protein GlcG (DUF336 family)